MHEKLLSEVEDGAYPEDPEEYLAENVFWVPPEARWNHLERSAKQSTIGKTVDEAMTAIERDNNTLLKVCSPRTMQEKGLTSSAWVSLLTL